MAYPAGLKSMALPVSYENIKVVNKELSDYQSKHKEDFKKIYDEIISKEKALLKKAVGDCGKKTVANLVPDLNDIDEAILKRKIDSSFYNADTMNATSCVIDATFYVPANTLGTLIRLKRWIKDLKKVGGSSTQGVALRGDLGTAEGVFIVKAPKGDHHNDDIIHEAFVSLYGTNRLRRTIPNFVYCYGTFSCASPILASDDHVASWCIGNSQVTYMITENVYPSVSYCDYIKTASREEFLCSYLQVLYALNEAYKMIDFTHYDLHSENILMREYTEEEYFQIPYNTERGKEYLVTNRVATIIDYGFTHIKYKNEHYGVNRWAYSIYANKSHIMHDAYKLLLMLARDLRDAESSLLDDVAFIFSFFSNDDMMEILEEHFDNDKFSIPLIDATIFDLTTFIRSNFECNFISTSPGKFTTLQCTLDNKCPNVRSIFSDIGLAKREYRQARDFIDYYEASRSTFGEISLNYEAARVNFENILIDDYSAIQDKLAKIGNMSRDSIEDYMSFLYALVETLDEYNTLLLEIYIGDKVMKENKETPDFSEFYILDEFKALVDIVRDNEKAIKDIEYEEVYNHAQVADRIEEIYHSISKQRVIE